MMAAGHGLGGEPGHRGRHRAPGRPGGAEPRGSVDPLRGSRAACFEEIAALPAGEGHPAHAGDLPGADQARPDRAAHPGDEGRRASSPPPASPRSGCASSPALTVEAGLDMLVIQGTVVSAEHVSTRTEPLNLKRVHRRFRPAGDRGWLRLLQHRPAPDAHRGGRGAGRGGPGGGLHHPRRARRRSAPGHCHRRRRRGPDPLPATRRAATSMSSPTAACAPAATSPRPSPAAPTR